MNRLLVVIAMLFGFAAVAGPAVAATHIDVPASVAGVVIVSGLSDACVEATPVAPRLTFKPCPNKYKGGIATFCHQVACVMPAAVVPAVPDAGMVVAPPGFVVVVAPSRPADRQFRPPRLFGNA